MKPCAFCTILAGQAPASIVYQDGLVTAFLDIDPVNPGHLLVVPNRHAGSLADLDVDSARQLLPVARRLAAGLYASGLRCEGINLFLADGAAAGQEVFHVHLHIVPRYPNDRFDLRFEHHFYAEAPSRAELDQVAGQILAGLRGIG